MNIEIIGRHTQVDEKLRELVEQKLGKLEKFLEEPVEARVTLATEKHNHYAVDAHVSHRFGTLQAHQTTGGSFQDAVNLVADTLDEQARRAHQKQVDRRRRAGGNHQWPVEVLEQDSVGQGIVPRVIETSHMPIKPMTIDEAALELDVAENGFVVFRDAANDRLSVLYKRKDHHYGLIAPEL